MCMWTSPWIWFAADVLVWYAIFANVLKNRCIADDPEFVSPLLPRDIRFSTNEGVYYTRMCRRFLKFALDVERVCMGKSTCFW